MNPEQYPSMERRHAARAYTRQIDYAPEDLLRSIADRLRGVCAHFQEQEFLRLVRRMAHVQWKYEQRARHGAALPRDG